MAKILVLGLSIAAAAIAGTISIDTSGNAADWAITAQSMTFAAFQNGSEITITSNGLGTGTTPLNLATWNGVWIADLTFFLPTNAVNIALNTSSMAVDDKALLTLNGVDFANALVFGGTGAGIFTRDGTNYENVVFANTQAVSVTNGFILGGLNTLRVYVNNTDTTDPNALATTFTFPTAHTGLDLSGSVTFDVAAQGVPEPASAVLVAASLGLIFLWLKRQPQS